LWSLTYHYEFYDGAQDQVNVLEEMHKNMATMFKEVLLFFCMDPKKVSMEDFFGDLKTFRDQYMVNIVFKHSVSLYFNHLKKSKLDASE
jgi:hypothetical protein